MENLPENLHPALFVTQSLSSWLNNVIVVDGPNPCMQCDGETTLVEVIFEAYLCSEACCNEAYAAYYRLCAATDFRHSDCATEAFA